MKPMICNFCF